jgi:hypothetical protein
MLVTTEATPSGITRVRRRSLAQRVSSFPLGSTTFRIAVGSEYTPPAASVAYAEAMSSGETAIEPRPIAGTNWPRTSSGVRTPSFRAIPATRPGPTSSVSCAYTVLSERSVACVTEVQPV